VTEVKLYMGFYRKIHNKLKLTCFRYIRFYYYHCIDTTVGGLLVPREVVSACCALSLYYYHCIDTTVGGLLVPREVVSACCGTEFLLLSLYRYHCWWTISP
jgi:hypothetical protein